MRKLEERLQKHVDLLVKRYPTLKNIEQSIVDAYLVLEKCYENDGKLLIAGNGGSAADSEHIAGELMKKFKTPRPVKKEFAEKLIAIDPERGAQLANNLECSLMAIPLVAHEALTKDMFAYAAYALLLIYTSMTPVCYYPTVLLSRFLSTILPMLIISKFAGNNYTFDRIGIMED